MGSSPPAPARRAVKALALLLLALLVTPAAAQDKPRRVALVVANSAYAQIAPLANPGNDARLVAQALEKVGFTVDVRPDLGLGGFMHALRDFRTRADGAEVALIYYAGHGVQVDGANFLVPTDAGMSASPDLAFEGVALDRVMMTLAGARMRVAVLDACRNDPFTRAEAGAVSGLAQVEVDDVLLIFSAAPGKQAADGAGSNSPFATAFADALPRPGVPLQMLGGVVRDAVIKSTENFQRPFISASVTGEPVYLTTPPASTPGIAGGLLTRSWSIRNTPGSIARPARARSTRPSEQWTASDPKLPMQSVSVERRIEGDRYRYIVSGIYPMLKRDGQPAPVARVIHFAPRQVIDGKARPIRAARRLKIGLWQPGAPFRTEASIERAIVDTTPGIELRLCMGETDDNGSARRAGDAAVNFCFFSPNLIKEGPQQLRPIERALALPG